MDITVLFAKRNDFAKYFELYLHNSSSVARMTREIEKSFPVLAMILKILISFHLEIFLAAGNYT